MKKISIALFFLAIVLTKTQNVSAQAVQQGDILIDPYVGGPNLLTGLITLASKSGEITSNLGTVTSFSTNGTTPFGLKGEYMLSNRFGLGLDLNHASTGIRFAGVDSVNVAYDVSMKLPRTRAIVTGSYHFGKSEKIDWYGIAGLGVCFCSPKLSGTYNTQNPSVGNAINQLEDVGNRASDSAISYAYRIGFGTHIYFTKSIGLNLEVGSGGPAFKAGIAVKI